MEEIKLSLITKKRLLARLAKNWDELSPREQKKFNALLLDLLPADQTFVENIRERYRELEDKEEATTPVWEKTVPKKIRTEDVEAKRAERSRVAGPKVEATKKVRVAPASHQKEVPTTPKKVMPNKAKQTKKPSDQKKSIMKKTPAINGQQEIVQEQKVQPVELNVRDEL